jgi:hypothetical protein
VLVAVVCNLRRDFFAWAEEQFAGIPGVVVDLRRNQVNVQGIRYQFFGADAPDRMRGCAINQCFVLQGTFLGDEMETQIEMAKLRAYH